VAERGERSVISQQMFLTVLVGKCLGFDAGDWYANASREKDSVSYRQAPTRGKLIGSKTPGGAPGKPPDTHGSHTRVKRMVKSPSA
jgi:hypothetical protein